MVIYSVRWDYKPCGDGRLPMKASFICFSVICRNSMDALKCLDFHFRHIYENPKGVLLEDGSVTLNRSKVDSRNFNAHYLLMDGMREPVDLVNLKSNIIRAHKIF